MRMDHNYFRAKRNLTQTKEERKKIKGLKTPSLVLSAFAIPFGATTETETGRGRNDIFRITPSP